MLLWILYVMKDNYFDAWMLPLKGVLEVHPEWIRPDQDWIEMLSNLDR